MLFSFNRIKMWIVVPVVLGLTVVSALHSISSVLARSSPEIALSVYPGNGHALQQMAYRKFAEEIKLAVTGSKSDDLSSGPDGAEAPIRNTIGPAEISQFAISASTGARAALLQEPLLPRAQLVLALAQAEPSVSREIIEFASRLNRRDIVLQGFVLQARLEEGDYQGAIGTLDQILRVRPERGNEFFPLLTEALREDATIPKFVELLTQSLPWRDQFLGFAVEQPDALGNLATVREAIALQNRSFDQRLIANLASGGDLDTAARLYEGITAGSLATNTDSLGWASDFPPFDWKFADSAGFRAQQSVEGDMLEFFIEPGQGGTLASRLLRSPGQSFSVAIASHIERTTLLDDLKLTITCAGDSVPFFDRTFRDTQGVFLIADAPQCRYKYLAITGRAWTGSAALTGLLEPVRITRAFSDHSGS